MTVKRVVVVGGGPAGMMAAGTAAGRGKEVILLEKNNKLGKKLYLTGKGRCNITNNIDIGEFVDNIPTNGDFLYSAFYSFSNTALINFLERLGLTTKVERGGRIFPASGKASDVIKVLQKYLQQEGVQIVLGGEVKGIEQHEDRITGVILGDGSRIETEKLILATGGRSYPATGSTGDGYRFARRLGHKITRLYPSLVPLKVAQEWVDKIRNLKLKNIDLSLYNGDKLLYRERGEMQFTGRGVEGPLVLTASSHLKNIDNNNYYLKIDLKPALEPVRLDRRIIRDFKRYKRKHFVNSLSDLLPGKLIPVIVDLAKIPRDKPVHQITRNERQHLVFILKNLRLDVIDYLSWEEAIVTSGGVSVREIDPSTMESKLIEGLYFAGEVIDVDGYTGGFNLQIAFSTGYLAGISC